MGQKKTVVISDIHMGTNTYPNWYRNDIHNPYLKHILNWVIQNKDQENIDELIILGDLFDFWTCPPDQTPPTATDIINHNSGILGEGGLLSQVLTALNGNVSYLRGNHDITITKNDINKIGNPGENIKFQPDIYVKDGVVYTHGHLFTMFNAPPFNEPPFDPKTPRDYKTVLPVGHFVTRAVSYSLQQKNHEEAAHEPGFGAPHMGFNALKSLLPPWPDSITEIPSFIEALIKLFDPSDFSFVDEFLKAVQGTTGTTDDTRFQLKDGLYSVDKNGNHQDFVTFAQVKEDYQSLWTEWVDRYKFGDDWRKSVERGSLYAYKAAWADYDGSYLGWYAQQLAFEKNADLVVMGHTHIPKRGLDEGVVDYINSGFECVPTPDMKKGQKMTYSIITTENGKLVSSKSKVMDIAEDGTSSNDNPPKAMVFWWYR
jgi:UDP-2,3-diacylglucosamine pyrophosphatase LpxH